MSYVRSRESGSINLVRFPEMVVFRLSGRDPAGMLNAVLTNDVPPGASGGIYALLLDAKGRIQTDLRVVKDGEDLLVVSGPEGAESAREILGRYAPFSRVRLEETGLSVLGVYGPRATGLFGLSEPLDEHESAGFEVSGVRALAVGVSVPVFGVDVISPPEDLERLFEHLVENGARPEEWDSYETGRILAGVPLFGSDVTPGNFPAEANLLERAVSFQKGCYPGQETVARMHYRGSPNKRLHRFEVEEAEGGRPEPGASIIQNDREVGFLTSVAPLAVEGKTLALGYLKRKADPEGELSAGRARLRVSETRSEER